jgi:hypothetical protein
MTRLKQAGMTFAACCGLLLWLSRNTRPDLSFAVAKIAQHVASNDPNEWKRYGRILRYLSNTLDLGIRYQRGDFTRPVSFTDSDWAGDPSSFSQSGYDVILAGGPIAWNSKKQTSVALSSAEAEIYATTDGGKQAMSVTNFMLELGADPETILPMPMYVTTRRLSH